MNRQNKLFALAFLTVAVALSLLAAYLDLPLLWRADTDEEIAYRHSSVLWALIVWTVAMAVWVRLFRVIRKMRRLRAQPSRQGIDPANIGCIFGALAFLGLLALETVARLAARP